MASLAGLAYWAMQNQVMGHPLKVTVGGKDRCMVAEMAPNRMAGGASVPQIRFVCDGYCGIYAKHPSKTCRTIDRQAMSSQPVAAPPGLEGVSQSAIATPYRSGEAGATPALPGQAQRAALPAPAVPTF